MINDPSIRSSCSQKALEEAHFSKASPSETAKKSRGSVRKTRQVALVTIQAAPTGTISIYIYIFFFLLPLLSSSILLNKKSNMSFKYSTVPFA